MSSDNFLFVCRNCLLTDWPIFFCRVIGFIRLKKVVYSPFMSAERETILNHSRLWIVISYFYMVVEILQPHWSVRSEPFAQLNK